MTRWVVCASLALLLGMVGCGGGGGGGGSGAPADPNALSMSLSTRHVSVSATTSDGPPTATVLITLDKPLASTIYAGSEATSSAVAGVQISGSATSGNVVITFKGPSTLGAGTYTDTITVRLCYDSPCAKELGNSPQTITTQLTVTQAPPPVLPNTPTIASLSPASIAAQSPAFTLTINGTGFMPGSTAQWNGAGRTTTFISPTQLAMGVSAADIAAMGTVVIAVSNADSGGGTATTPYTILPPGPMSLTRIGPSSVQVGGPDFTLTAMGTSFGPSSQIAWNGTPVPTTYVSHTELLALIPAARIAATGQASITVSDTAAPSTFSAALPLQIVPASIDAVSYQINPSHNGVVNFKSVTLPANSKWSVQFPWAPSYALIANGKVFVTFSTGPSSSQLLALDQATGATAWGPIALTGGLANAVYDNGTVFVLSSTIGSPGYLAAYDAATGTPKWNTTLKSQYWFSSPPTAGNGFVMVAGAGSGTTLYAVDQATGAQVWTQPVNSGGEGAPMMTTDTVMVSGPCTAEAYRLLTGEKLWSNNTGCTGGGGGTSVARNNIVYASDGNFSLGSGNTFNVQTGQLLGSWAAMVVPAIGSTDGYFLQSQVLRAINLTNNSIHWTFSGDGGLITSPIVVNQYVFIGSTTGMLFALDSSTGQQVWSFNIGAPLPEGAFFGKEMPFTGLTAGDGLLLVPTGQTLTAFQLSTNP